jgi:arginine-tRNA-protein transferase
MRIKISDFVLTPSQQRVMKRCEGLFSPEIADACLSEEKVELYRRYQLIKHLESLTENMAIEAYQRFLVESCTQTKEMRWRTREGKLVGVGILDITPTALSSVYFYWDPDFADFSLGTYSVIKEIAWAQSLALSYYYLGYFVPGSASMEYKSHFGPAEIWNGREWERLRSKSPQDPQTYEQLRLMEEGNFEGDRERFDLSKAFQLGTMPK